MIPSLTALMLAASCGLALLGMVFVAWRDATELVIDPFGLSVAALPAVSAAVIAGGPSAAWDAVAAGGLMAALAALARRLAPTRIGAGDIGLLAAFGLIAGLELLPPAAALLAALSLAFAACWSLRRGKRLFRSAFPAAPPAMGAAAAALLWRASTADLADASPEGTVPVFLTAAAAAGLATLVWRRDA